MGAPEDVEKVISNRYCRMLFCVVGIMGSFLLYGLLQERIMTQPYGDGEMFRSSAFLVLNNRIVAMIIAFSWMIYNKEPLASAAPIYKCMGISVSNTAATFCQYEALKYVSFPTQTLGKCGKMIPVLILGTIFLNKTHSWKEILVAFLVTLGCVLFVLTGVSPSSQFSQGIPSSFFLLFYV
jgi:adenosine 3'-phospho 5'-phosphosulfate transporter B2